MFYPINEENARRGHENHHMITDYREGDATREYRKMVDEFAQEVDAAKTKTDDESIHARLDKLLDRFAKRLADWVNENSANDARHVAWFIAGRSNYNMRAQEKWSNKNDKLMREWEEIRDMSNDIARILHRKDVIMAGDADAVERIEKKIETVKAHHAEMKRVNAEARRTGKEPPFPGYELTYALAEVKRLEGRLKTIKNTKEGAQHHREYPVAEGVRVEENTELMRIQLFFDEKPDANIRETMHRKYGFRWAPSQGAWQRQLTGNGRAAAVRLMEELSNRT